MMIPFILLFFSLILYIFASVRTYYYFIILAMVTIMVANEAEADATDIVCCTDHVLFSLSGTMISHPGSTILRRLSFARFTWPFMQTMYAFRFLASLPKPPAC